MFSGFVQIAVAGLTLVIRVGCKDSQENQEERNGPEDAEPTAELQACSGIVPGRSWFITYPQPHVGSVLQHATCVMLAQLSALAPAYLWLLEKTEPPSEESRPGAE